MIPGTRRWAWILPALLALAVPCASGAAAQVVSGTLLEQGTTRPVILGRVALLDTALTVVDLTYTDHEGTFTLRAPGPGDYWVAADGPGYRPMIDGIVELGQGGFLPVHLYLRPGPIELPGLTATVRRERIVEKLVDAGFYRRQQAGFGHFVTPEEIRERQPMDIPDLLRRVPGPAFQSSGVLGTIPLFRARGPGGYCYPRVYVDGLLVWSSDMPPPPPTLEELVAVEDIVGVEVYAGGASAPLQWGGSQGNCGVMVFWTESGG